MADGNAPPLTPDPLCPSLVAVLNSCPALNNLRIVLEALHHHLWLGPHTTVKPLHIVQLKGASSASRQLLVPLGDRSAVGRTPGDSRHFPGTRPVFVG